MQTKMKKYFFLWEAHLTFFCEFEKKLKKNFMVCENDVLLRSKL
jgi:hypothetical protein